MDLPILSLLIFTPLLGAACVFLTPGTSEQIDRNAKNVGLFVSLITLGLAISAWSAFDATVAGYQFEELYPWLPSLNISYHLGVDGISLPFILLTAFLIPICLIASWGAVKKKVREYVVAFLVL